MYIGGEGGIDSRYIHVSGLRLSSHVMTLPIAPAIGEPGFASPPGQTKKPHPSDEALLVWRRGWDLNPRRAINPCQFSRLVHSTALPPLRDYCGYLPRRHSEALRSNFQVLNANIIDCGHSVSIML